MSFGMGAIHYCPACYTQPIEVNRMFFPVLVIAAMRLPRMIEQGRIHEMID